MLHILRYDVVEGFAERRAAFRARHLSLARAAHGRGELLYGGAFGGTIPGSPLDGALLVFAGDDASVAERFARADPYVTEGLVTRWQVHAWHEVVSGRHETSAP